ncbi:MAG: beta-lactamase family protein [Ktedonobacteraceae bacterium]|nr:beta-lactamase family protein [Ktedonobacteraceae bacterium]
MFQLWANPDFEPGTQYLYSNSGYCLLGKIIEVASGMSYEAFIQTHIFRPLSMKHSYYMSNEPIIPSRASGYVKTVHGYEHAPSLSMTWPYTAGSLGSSLADLIRWDAALPTGCVYDFPTSSEGRLPDIVDSEKK